MVVVDLREPLTRMAQTATPEHVAAVQRHIRQLTEWFLQDTARWLRQVNDNVPCDGVSVACFRVSLEEAMSGVHSELDRISDRLESDRC